jgi:hypothetical protein
MFTPATSDNKIARARRIVMHRSAWFSPKEYVMCGFHLSMSSEVSRSRKKIMERADQERTQGDEWKEIADLTKVAAMRIRW